MDTTTHHRHGDELYRAFVERRTVEPLRLREPDITLDDAYRIQLRMVERRLAAGETIVGKKIGVTSKVARGLAGQHPRTTRHRPT